MTVALLFALAACLGGLTDLFQGSAWWLMSAGLAAFVLVTSATVRTLFRGQVLPVLAGCAALLVGLTAMFSAGNSALLVIPTPGTLARFSSLFASGGDSIQNQGIPVVGDQGILFILCASIGLIAVLLDVLAFVLRRPVVIGIPLFFVLVLPSFIEATLTNVFFIALGAAAYLLVLYIASGEQRGFGAIAAGAGGIAMAVVLPFILPPVALQDAGNQATSGYSTGLNPIINLGSDLRRTSSTTLFQYSTDSSSAQYFMLRTFSDLSGATWLPTLATRIEQQDLADIGPAPGIGADVHSEKTTTKVTMSSVGGVWLPVPYAASSVTGLSGDWSWLPDSLAVHTDTSSVRDQVYVVKSSIPEPSADQLIASDTTVDPDLAQYLTLPDDMPPIISETAQKIAGDKSTNYDKALALQRYFRGGSFTYSTTAPVENGYDGTGTEIVAKFLDVKSGYCIHFASAMAVMARTLGIPSRFVVGLTAGGPKNNEDEIRNAFIVTTNNLHAWPELYFSGVGWVRFEPTPGRGQVPGFAPSDPGEPITPGTEATPHPTASATPVASASPTAAAAGSSTNNPGEAARVALMDALLAAGAIAALAVVFLVPFFIRTIRRYGRMRRIRRSGSATVAWREVNETARDFGLPAAPNDTPRQLAATLRSSLDGEGSRALDRLLGALERTAFAQSAGNATVSDLVQVRAQLWRAAPRAARLRALFLPASLLPASLLPASLLPGPAPRATKAPKLRPRRTQ